MPKDRRELMDPKSGFFQGLVQQGKLIMRLIGDKNVNFFLKLLPIASIVYVLSPVDLAPGITLPIIGALDDAAVLWMGSTLFLSLCPDEIVERHRQALERVIHGKWRDADASDASKEIIEVKAAPPPDEQQES